MSHHVSEIQTQVDHAIRALGGYWRPLSALARLIEEIGEVSEIMPLKTGPLETKREDFRDELTDIFIISTCLANQYCTNLDAEYSQLGYIGTVEKVYEKIEKNNPPLHSFLQLISQAGQVARTLNHYEGDKKKKKTEKHRRLAEDIARLQLYLLEISKSFDLFLFDHVSQTLEKNIQRDKGRFDITYDPITEASRELIIRILKNKETIKSDRIWGLPSWNVARTFGENMDSSLLTYRRFMKVGISEELEGLTHHVQAQDGLSTVTQIADYTAQFIHWLKQHFPSLSHQNEDYEVDVKQIEAILEQGKPYELLLHDQVFYLYPFAEIYPKNHPFHTSEVQKGVIYYMELGG